MPTYVYKCKVCEHQFETFQKITDEPVKDCPVCGGGVGKVLYPPSIVVRGSGFHINDYPSSSSSTSGNGKKPETASESKPETKAETLPAKA